MNADEIVRALRCVQEKHRNDRLLTFQTDVSAMARDAADLIESLQAEVGAAHTREDAAYAALEKAQRKTDMAVSDIICADNCDVCLHKDSGTSCERVDFDCAECDDPVCVCRCCRDEDKWEWRGNAE